MNSSNQPVKVLFALLLSLCMAFALLNCGDQKAVGQACQNSDECQQGLTCKEGKCTTPANEPTSEVPSGEPPSEQTSETASELAKEPANEPANEPSKEPVQEPVQEPQKPVSEVIPERKQEHAGDGGGEQPPELPREAVIEQAPSGFDAKNCSADGDCASGMKCYRGNVCLTPCDKAKGVKNNPDCGTGFVCAAWTSSMSVCKKSCDNSQGKFGNPECATKFYCSSGSGDLAPGYCEPNRKALIGPKGIGETCDVGKANEACQTGFQCIDFVCVATCVPGAGSGCSAGKECAESTLLSPTGGYCAPMASQDVGDWCDNIARRCKSGLTCRSRQCRKKCTQDTDCGTDEVCALTFCYKKCDTSKDVGSTTKKYNPDCQVGQYCDTFSGKNVCRAAQRAPNPAGKKKSVGDSCQVNDENPATACSSQEKLICRSGCKEACDPRKGTTNNPDCDNGSKGCTPSVFSYLNGICNP